MIHLSHPVLLLLAVPVWLIYCRWARAPGLRGIVRTVLLGVLIFMSGGPNVPRPADGELLVLVLDRSESMPERFRSVQALVRMAEEQREANDQIALVGFGAMPIVERFPRAARPSETNVRRLDASRSNLHAAIGRAIALIPQGKRGRLLVFSDGLAHDLLAESTVSQAAARGIQIDFRHVSRPRSRDLVLESVRGPARVRLGTEAKFQLLLRSQHEATATLRVSNNGKLIQSLPLQVHQGKTSIHHRFVSENAGVVCVRFEVEVPGDPIPENNSWDVLVEVQGDPAALLVRGTGTQTALAASLKRFGLEVDLVEASQLDLSLGKLFGYRLCVLENAPATELSWTECRRLANYVQHLGGALLVTGGQHSFLAGGYRLSPIDALLPVTLLSGRAGAPRVPMSLYVVAELEENWSGEGGSRGDQFAQTIQALAGELQPGDRFGLAARVGARTAFLGLSTGERGKHLAEAFRASSVASDVPGSLLDVAITELRSAPPGPKHLLFCIDAGLFAQLRGEIAGQFRGLGNATATTVVLGVPGQPVSPVASIPSGMPRSLLRAETDEQLAQLFAYDLARQTGAGIVNRITSVRYLESSDALAANGQLLRVANYHAADLQFGAEATLMAADHPAVPLAARCVNGRGRVGVLLFPVGRMGAQPVEGSAFDEFLRMQYQWLTCLDISTTGPAVTVDRSAQLATVTIPRRFLSSWPDQSARQLQLSVVRADDSRIPRNGVTRVPFRVQGDELIAQFPLERPGNYFPVIGTGNRLLARIAPVRLPRSREFLGRLDPSAGRAVLAELAGRTGGQEWREDMRLFAEPTLLRRSLIAPLAWVALLLLLLEVADQRLGALGPLGRLLALGRGRGWPGESQSAEESKEDSLAKAKQLTKRRLGH